APVLLVSDAEKQPRGKPENRTHQVESHRQRKNQENHQQPRAVALDGSKVGGQVSREESHQDRESVQGRKRDEIEAKEQKVELHDDEEELGQVVEPNSVTRRARVALEEKPGQERQNQ